MKVQPTEKAARCNVANKTSPKTIENREKVERALQLRKAGATFEQIADRVGYSSPGNAYRAISNAVSKIGREDARQFLEMELLRLDELQLIAWQVARSGDLKAIETVLKIMDRRAKYLGLDQSERRTADAAERSADAIQQATDQQAAWLYQTMMAVLDRLNLSTQQRQAAPTIILGELGQDLELESGDKLAE